LPHWRRQILSRQKILADRCKVAEAFDDPVDGERRDIGAWVFQQYETRVSFTNLGHGCGTPRVNRHRFATAICASARPVAIRSTRSSSRSSGENSSTGRATSGWSAAKAMHNDLRGLFARCKDFRKRAANQRRWVVQQHDHRAFRGSEIVGRQIGVKICACQCGSGLCPLPGRCLAHPLQKLTNDHGKTLR
jgi:hypothetical protein